MASTPSQNNAFELMTTGEKSGQWGDITNVNMQIIDRATKGVGSIALTGSGDQITTVDYTPSNGHYAVLVFSGTAGMVTINPNDQQKVFIVKNTTAGTVTLTQGSGGNVTISAGKSAIVYADGAGTGAAVVDVTSTFNFLAPSDIGSTVQAYDAGLTSIASLPTISNKMLFTTGTDTWTTTDLTLFARTLLDDSDAAAARATLLTASAAETLTNKSIALGSNTVTGTTSQFNTALTDGDFATLAGSETLTNKSIALGSNTVTGTTAQFNTALTDGDFATLAGSETLTNKTLTSPTVTSPTVTGAPYVNGAYQGNVSAVAALNIDCSTGNYFTKTINANSTFTFSNAPTSRAYGFTLELTVTSGTVTWPASVRFPGGASPILTAGKTHLVMFVTDDSGTRWRGAALTDYET